MPSANVLPQANLSPGTYTSSPLAVPAGATRVAITAILSDAEILTAGMRLLSVLYVSRDGGLNFEGFAGADWSSGPDNGPRFPGNPPPRPGSGTIDLPVGATHLRGELGITRADNSKVRIGIQVDYS